MWQKILAFFAAVINLGNLFTENQQMMKELQKQVDANEKDIELLVQKMEHFAAMERSHHRQNLLELENRILQMEKRLPPANDN